MTDEKIFSYILATLESFRNDSGAEHTTDIPHRTFVPLILFRPNVFTAWISFMRLSNTPMEEPDRKGFEPGRETKLLQNILSFRVC